MSSPAEFGPPPIPSTISFSGRAFHNRPDKQAPPAGLEPAAYGLGSRVLTQARMALSSLAARLYSNRLLLQEPAKRSKNMREYSVFRRFLRRIPYGFGLAVRPAGAQATTRVHDCCTTARSQSLDQRSGSWPYS